MEDQSRKKITSYLPPCFKGKATVTTAKDPSDHHKTTATTTTTTTGAGCTINSWLKNTTAMYDKVNYYGDIPIKEKMIMFLLLITMLSAVVVFFASIIISLMEFTTPKVEIESVTVYPFEISSSSISANWNFNFSVQNPNGAAIYYDDMEATVLLRDERICSTDMGYLFLGGFENEKFLQVKIESFLTNINESVAENVMAEKRETGTVTFSFKLDLSATKNPGPNLVTMKRRKVIVLCLNLKVRFFHETGTLLGGKFRCKVNVLANE